LDEAPLRRVSPPGGGLGSVTELLDEDGDLAQAYEYDAWGTPTLYDPDHTSQNPYLFTGRRWDPGKASPC